MKAEPASQQQRLVDDAMASPRAARPVLLTLMVAQICFASFSCTRSSSTDASQESPVSGKVAGGWGVAARVVYGKGWALGHEAVATSAGDFQVPSWAGAVTAYIDFNSNRKFDRFAEPSAVCNHDGEGWRCTIPRQRATVLREVSTRDHNHLDSIYVFWEDYRQDGAPVAQAKLCVKDRCTQPQPSPFLAETAVPARWLSLCGTAELAPGGTMARTASNTAIPIARPAAIDAHVAMQRQSSGLVVKIAATEADRALVWAGVSGSAGEVQNVYWHSEAANSSVTRTAGGLEVDIPDHAAAACTRDPRCVLVVQILKYWRSTNELVLEVTERRQAMDPRGRS